MEEISKIFGIIILILMCVNLISALSVIDVSQKEIFPGESGNIVITLKNNLNEDVTDVSFNLLLSSTPFISVGSSEGSDNEIREDRETEMNFKLKASQDALPGNYNIPFRLTYTNEADGVVVREGTIGIVIGAETELSFVPELENNILGKVGTINLRIINSGFGDAKFVSVEIIPQGYTLLSNSKEYVGTINSDDFESISYDVIFKDKNSKLIVNVNYKDFYNEDKFESVEIPLKVYSEEEALNLGLIKRSSSIIYVAIIIPAIVVWFVYSRIRKRRNKRK